MADALEGRRHEVVSLADRETALGSQRLEGELTRTCYQLRLFAEVLDEGSYLEAAIDHAGNTSMGPRPDLRRMLVPICPVAVFGASNFPLAFSVPGGDTAAALAAGCPVVVKAHPSHPATSQLCFEILYGAASATTPEGTLSLVHGLAAGTALAAHPAIRAVAFTGSLRGGKALMAIIEQRRDPIPFFGELSSLNPLVVTPQAANERAEELGRGIVGSFTLGAGQFCTKPGLILVPTGTAGDALVHEMAARVSELSPQWMLNEGVAAAYLRGTTRLMETAGVEVVALLGTRYTMEQAFYVGRLRELHGLTVLVPDEPDRTVVHDVIYQELVRGITSPLSKSQYLDIVERLVAQGAQGVIAGCTEIELLIGPADLRVPMFPTAYLHAVAAVDFALTE